MINKEEINKIPDEFRSLFESLLRQEAGLLKEENCDLRKEISCLKMESQFLREEIRYLKRLVYGSKSEKRKKIDLPPNQPTLFDGQDEIKEIQDQEANKEALLSQMESENSNSNDPSTPPKPPSKSSAKRGGRRPLRTIPPHVKTTNPEATGCKPPRNGYESV